MLCASRSREDPFSLSYGANLPSSLTMSRSSALVLSHPATCVRLRYGRWRHVLSGFSREHAYRRCPLPRRVAVLSGSARHGGLTCLPFAYPLQRAIPSARGRVTSPSPLRSRHRLRNVYRIAIRSAVRLPVRSRLTLPRLASDRNPWPSGVGVYTPIVVTYAYICFSRRSTAARTADSTRRQCSPTARLSRRTRVFGTGLMPDYYPRAPARLVSCYALFE